MRYVITRRFFIGMTLWLGLVSIVYAADTGTGTISGTVDPVFLKKSGVLVYIEEVEGEFKPKNAEMDQKKMEFIPHILPVVAGAKVKFKNNDSTNHNIFSPDGEYNLGTWGKGEEKDISFDDEGVFVQLCNIHPEMEAFVVVLQNPYWAVVEKKSDGSFQIDNVPTGEYRLKIWGSRLKKKDLKLKWNIECDAGKTTGISITRPSKK